MNLPENMFFIPLDLYQFPLFKEGTLMKNRFFRRFMNTPNILCGGILQYPYLTQNTVGMGGFIFSIFDLG